MTVLRNLVKAAAGALVLALGTSSAFAAKAKIDFWFGNSGDIAKRVQEVCQHFNDSQKDYEIVCTSQGTYAAAVQNTIAAYRAGQHPTIVQLFDTAPLALILPTALYPPPKLIP